MVVKMTKGKLEDVVVCFYMYSGNCTRTGTTIEKKPKFMDSWNTIREIC